MTKVIYTGAFRFPDGDAAAARVLGIGKALRDARYEVEYAGWEEKERAQDLQADGRYAYEGFCYASQADLRSERLSPLKRLFRYLSAGRNTLSWLRSHNMAGVEAIIAYHGSSIFLSRLAAFCSERRIKLIIDCTEWYDSRQLVGGRFGLVSFDNYIRMRLINPRIGSIIAISSYLEKYYVGKGCHVINVPPLVDLNEEKWKGHDTGQCDSRKLRLIYAGVPGKKDLLGNAIRGLKVLLDRGAPVEMHLVGPSRDAVAACLGEEAPILDDVNDALVFYGRVPQDQVPRLLSAADFSLLMRPRERYAEAGFSTKLVESLAAGVPVMVNPTGDITRFVADGREGIVLSDHSPTAFVMGVERVLAMPEDRRREMRRAARVRAAASFDYRAYVSSLCEFIEKVEI